MKKSKYVTLVLITAALASCQSKQEKQEGASGDWGDEKNGKKVYMRSDTTAQYTRTHHSSGIGSAILWYYAFRPYSSGYGYRSGFYSGGLSHRSNVGYNPAKSSVPRGVTRGGFGGRGFSAS